MMVTANWQAIWSNPFFAVALPIVITLIVAMVTQNKRIDDLRKRIDDLRDSINQRLDRIEQRLDGIDRRLESIEAKLSEHGERIARLERAPLVR
jgi:hypothetical protein